MSRKKKKKPGRSFLPGCMLRLWAFTFAGERCGVSIFGSNDLEVNV